MALINPSDASDDDRKEFVLASLRAASLRARLFDVEITSIGTALKAGLVSTEGVIRWLKDINQLDAVFGGVPPGTVQDLETGGAMGWEAG